MAGDEFPTTQGKSMPINQLSQQRVTDLHRSYGDAALGKAQGRRFQTTKSGEPRTNTSRLVKSVARQAARLFNAVAPGGRRAEPKFREAVRDCSHRTGDLLGVLAGQNTAISMKSAVDRCVSSANVAATLANNEAVDGLEVFKTRLEVHLKAVTVADLQTMQEAIPKVLVLGSDKAGVVGETLTQAIGQEFDRRLTHAVKSLVDHLVSVRSDTPRRDHVAKQLAQLISFESDAGIEPDSMRATLEKVVFALKPHERDYLRQAIDKLTGGDTPVFAQTSLQGSALAAVRSAALTQEEIFSRELQLTTEKPFKPAPADANVDEAMWKDLVRADYVIASDDGKNRFLLDRDNLPPAEEGQRADFISGKAQTLRGMTSTDSQWQSLSKVVNQNLMAAFTTMQTRPDSPVKLGDAYGLLVGDSQSSRYTMKKLDNGTIEVAVVFHQERASQLVNPNDGNTVRLNPETSSATYKVSLTIATDGSVSVASPPSVNCTLHPEYEAV